MMTLSMLDKIFSRQIFDRSNFIQEVYQFPYKYNLQEIRRIYDGRCSPFVSIEFLVNTQHYENTPIQRKCHLQKPTIF